MIRPLLMGTLIIMNAAVAFGFDHSHAKFTNVLESVNKDGLINYPSLKSNPTPLNNYLTTLNAITRTDYNKWTDAQKIAFWINAYNAFTLKAIVNHYPIKASLFKSALYPKNSIRQISGVWDKLTFPVLGEKMTLDAMEHQTLRKHFNEPRIHMALVCAALSCPPLRKEAFTGEKLEAQLDDQSRLFLSSPAGTKIDTAKSKVWVSMIFDWFGEDFVKTYGTKDGFANKNETQRAVLNFLSNYLPPRDKQYLDTANYDLKYLKYDWTLNEQ